MANNIPVDKLTGELAKLNTELKQSATYIGEILSEGKKLNTELSKVKKVTDLQKQDNAIKTNNLKLQKEQNTLLLSQQKLADASIRQKAAEAKAEQELIKQKTLNIKKSEQMKKTRQQAIKTQTAKLNLDIKERKEIERLAAAETKRKAAIEKSRLAQEKANATKKKSGGLFRSVTKSIIAASVAMIGFRTVLNVFKNSLSTIANFEQAMSKVRAVTGALPKDFKALTDDAKRLGSATSKSATQVAALQLEFSKLGFSTTEILNATEATISLSVAAGSDLAESAVVAASTIRGFGLNASETQRIVDVMAKSFASSALDLEKFKVSMAAVAPIAKANGKDIEFVTARLSVLSDAGLDASTSGTSLRNMFLELSKRGLTWEQGLAKINTSTNKNVTALELFGKRGATAALILADNIDKAQGLEKAYDGAAGSAKEMADIMEDNLIGDVAKLSSAWEGFILGLNKGEGVLSQFFRDAVQLVTKLTGAIQQLTKSENERKEDKIQESINIKKDEYLKKLNDELSRKKLLKNEDEARNNLIDEEIDRVKWLIEFNKKRADEEAGNNLELSYAIDNIIKTYDGYLDILIGLKTVAKDTNSDIIEGDKEVTKSGVKRNKILIESELNYLQKRKALEDLIREQSEKFLGDKIESEDDMTDRLLGNLQKRVDGEFAAQQLITDREQKAAEERAQIRDEFINTSQELGNVLFDLGQAQRDRELEGVRSNYAAQIAAAEGNTELQEKLAKDLAREEARIQRQQAQSERNQALFNIAISTAKNIVEAFPVIPLMAFAGALGIAQTAAVLSAPLPEVPGFFKGTESAPAGLKWVAEQGSELINMPDGSSFLAKEKQLINTSGGEQILNHADTTRALNGAIYEDIAMNGNEGIESRLDGIAGKLGSLKQLNVNFDADGMDIRMQKGNSSIQYLNKKGSK